MKTEDVASLFRLLLHAYGPQGWWPADHPWEVCVGAILTQRVAWRNAEAAIEGLRRSKILTPAALAHAPEAAVAEAIRPALFYHSKAAKLKDLARVAVTRWGGDMARLRAEPTDTLRETLLGIHGVGNETADAILVYVAHRPAFIADRYALRLFERLGWTSMGAAQTRTVGAAASAVRAGRAQTRTVGAAASAVRAGRAQTRTVGAAASAVQAGRAQTRTVGGGYEAVRAAVMAAWAADADAYGELHALIVCHGKKRCRPKPSCSGCPLTPLCSVPNRQGGAA